MKSIIRIFNFIILGISGLAIALLFISSTLSFNSRLSFDTEFINTHFDKVVDQINAAAGSTDPSDPILSKEYIKHFNVATVLGTDHINLSIKFDLNFTEVNTLMGKADRDLINQELIDGNIDSVFLDLHEPIDILTEYTVRTVLKSIAEKEIYKQIKNSLDDNPHATSTPIEVMDEIGMNDNYFRGFAKALYDAADNREPHDDTLPEDSGCSINLFVDVIFNKLKTVLQEASAATGGQVSEDSLTPEMKDQIKNSFLNIIQTAGLIQEDGQTFVKISKASYVFLAKLLKEALSSSSVPASELEPLAGETREAYAKRLSKLYVHNMLPDVFYTIVGYTALGLFIGILVFAAIWAILFIITLVRTFSKEKPWTIFGAWFWIFGSLQVVLGLALTVFCKFYLPGLSFVQNALAGTPIKTFAVAPRTSVLIPSMLFLGMIVFAIIYTIFAHSVKRDYKDNMRNKGPKPKEVIIHE